jgi:hypothetical protein
VDTIVKRPCTWSPALKRCLPTAVCSGVGGWWAYSTAVSSASCSNCTAAAVAVAAACCAGCRAAAGGASVVCLFPGGHSSKSGDGWRVNLCASGSSFDSATNRIAAPTTKPATSTPNTPLRLWPMIPIGSHKITTPGPIRHGGANGWLARSFLTEPLAVAAASSARGRKWLALLLRCGPH